MTNADHSGLRRKVTELIRAGRHAELIALADKARSEVLAIPGAGLRLGAALIAASRIQDAETVFRDLIERNPDDIESGGALARLFIITGRGANAEPIIAELQEKSKTRPQAAMMIADIYLQAGRVLDAHATLAAAAAKFGDPRIDARLAETSIRIGDAEGAIKHGMRAIKASGLSASTLGVAGPAALLAGDKALYQLCLEALSTIDENAAAGYFDYWLSLLMDGDHLPAAAVVAEDAAERAPNPQRLQVLADLRLSKKDVDGAEEAIREALAMNARDAGALVLAARCQIYRGELDAAIATLREAIKADRKCASAYDYLTQVDAAAIDAKTAEYMQSRLEQGALDVNAAPKMHLALARCQEQTGDFKGAFENIVAGKKILAQTAKASGRGYKPEQTLAMVDVMKRAFPEPAPGGSPDSDAPQMIFIVGMPRSGTSLVEQILAVHQDVYGAGEMQGMLRIVNSLFRSGFEGGDIRQKLLAESASLARQFRETLPAAARDSRFCTDKHPLNFWSVGVIAAISPGAKIVHVYRPAVETCLSILRVRFFGDYAFASEIDSVAHYYACYEAMMRHWKRIFGDLIYDVDYSALTSEQERETRALLEACGLAWDEACLSPHAAKREVLTHSAAQVRAPINKKSEERRRGYGEVLNPLADALEKHRAALADEAP